MDGTDANAIWVYAGIVALGISSMALMSYLDRRSPGFWPGVPGTETEREKRAKAKKMPNPKQRELAHEMLSGFTDVVDARMLEARSQLDLLVDVIYRHRMKLCARAGLDFEDADLEKIFSAYEQLNRLYADEMYDQGWYDARAHERTICRKAKTPKKQGSGY